mgnify:CR=1 FL=1
MADTAARKPVVLQANTAPIRSQQRKLDRQEFSLQNENSETTEAHRRVLEQKARFRRVAHLSKR